MKTRTMEQTVTFRGPFALTGHNEALPAGTFSVETTEELIAGGSHVAYRRLSTLLRPYALPRQGQLTQAYLIDPDELRAALQRDRQSAQPSASATAPHRQEPDQRAIERAENEGMIAQPA